MQANRMNARAGDTAEMSLLDKVRSHVLGLGYEPGSLVPEAALASEFNVSRTPIREVLKQLEIEGLVEIRPRVGTFVRRPTRRELIELFQLKESLEGLAANLLAWRGPVPELATLERNLADSDAAAQAGDSEAYAELVHEFHWTLMRGADNHKLYEAYERLMNQLAYHRLVTRSVSDPNRLAASGREHRAVVDAIRQKDPLGAEFAMRNHVHASSRVALTPERSETERGHPGDRER